MDSLAGTQLSEPKTMNSPIQTTEDTDHTESGQPLNLMKLPHSMTRHRLPGFSSSVCSVFSVVLTLAFAVAAPAQLPSTSPTKAGFDPARLEVAHATPPADAYPHDEARRSRAMPAY